MKTIQLLLDEKKILIIAKWDEKKKINFSPNGYHAHKLFMHVLFFKSHIKLYTNKITLR